MLEQQHFVGPPLEQFTDVHHLAWVRSACSTLCLPETQPHPTYKLYTVPVAGQLARPYTFPGLHIHCYNDSWLKWQVHSPHIPGETFGGVHWHQHKLQCLMGRSQRSESLTWMAAGLTVICDFCESSALGMILNLHWPDGINSLLSVSPYDHAPPNPQITQGKPIPRQLSPPCAFHRPQTTALSLYGSCVASASQERL